MVLCLRTMFPCSNICGLLLEIGYNQGNLLSSSSLRYYLGAFFEVNEVS